MACKFLCEKVFNELAAFASEWEFFENTSTKYIPDCKYQNENGQRERSPFSRGEAINRQTTRRNINFLTLAISIPKKKKKKKGRS